MTLNKNKDNTFVVIMAGGIGSRFWPYSRTNHPKQFHDILGTGKTLIQETAHRFREVAPISQIFTVTNKKYIGLVNSQLPLLSDNQILAEPIGRNTAPCVAYAAYKIAKTNPDAVMVVASSDHIIEKEEGFVEIINQAIEEASQKDILLTLGIKPDRPDTGYGYIQFKEGKSISKKVKTFTEKPELELAKKFLESGDFLWNSGIFIWKVKTVIQAFEKHLPEMAEIFEEGKQYYNTDKEADFIAKAYTQTKNISVDYGIMEKADNVHVISCDFGWSDLGTWKSLHSIGKKDTNNNVASENVMLYDTKNCIIKTPEDRLVVVQGLDDYIIAEFDNVLMICRKDEEQKVRDFVADVKNKKGNDYI
jgi:mannose-1-phosphate guanylyltransferase